MRGRALPCRASHQRLALPQVPGVWLLQLSGVPFIIFSSAAEPLWELYFASDPFHLNTGQAR